MSSTLPVSDDATHTARIAPTCSQTLRQMNGSQRLALVLDICDVTSDFLFAFSVQKHKYSTLVLLFAFIGLVTVGSKLLIIRRAFLNGVDDWDLTLQLIHVGYLIFIVEDIPQIILLFVIVGNKPWTFFPKCSLGILIISVAWKLIQETLLIFNFIVIDETGERETYCEKFFCKTKKVQNDLNCVNQNSTQNIQFQSWKQTPINTPTVIYSHGKVMNLSGIHNTGTIQM